MYVLYFWKGLDALEMLLKPVRQGFTRGVVGNVQDLKLLMIEHGGFSNPTPFRGIRRLRMLFRGLLS